MHVRYGGRFNFVLELNCKFYLGPLHPSQHSHVYFTMEKQCHTRFVKTLLKTPSSHTTHYTYQPIRPDTLGGTQDVPRK